MLNDRKRLSENGFVNIIIAVNNRGDFISQPKLVSRGFVYNKESEQLLIAAREVIVKTLKDLDNKKIIDYSLVKKKIIATLNKFFYEKTKRSPLILIEMMEIRETLYV